MWFRGIWHWETVSRGRVIHVLILREVSELRRLKTDACYKYALDYINTIVSEKLTKEEKNNTLSEMHSDFLIDGFSQIKSGLICLVFIGQ